LRNRRPVAPVEATDSRSIYFGGGGGNDLYDKGACILHTLRYLLGDEKFFRCLRRFCYPTAAMEKVTDGSQVRLVDTEDFRRLVEGIAGQDLGWFFAVYLRQPKLPRLVATAKDGVLSLRWQVAEGLPFPMPVEVEIAGRRQRVAMPGGEAAVELPAEGAWQVDPQRWILRG
jgi:aminopeptidase N